MTENETGLVSVIIPTYNRGHCLARALKSVLDQTYVNWEAIIVDNHSTDNTDEVLARFDDSRIKYFQVHNHGVIAVSRNLGIQKSKGEIIAFLDSDDWWYKTKLEVCINQMADNLDVVYHRLAISSRSDRVLLRKSIRSWQVKRPVVKDLLIRGNALATSSVVVRKGLFDKIGGMNESEFMIGSEDYNAWLCIAMATDRFKFLPEILGYYQIHEKGYSQKDMSTSLKSAATPFIQLLSRKEINRFEALVSFTRGRYNFSVRNYIDAQKDLAFCLKCGSFTKKIKAAIMATYILITTNVSWIFKK